MHIHTRTRAGSHLVKNKYLEQELRKVKRTHKMFGQVLLQTAVQSNTSTSFRKRLTIFKTAIEIDQMVLVEQAKADRQEYLCQGQSLNLFFPSLVQKRKTCTKSHFAAWKLGTKGLYYLRTETSQRAENVAEKVQRDALKDFETQALTQDECVACQG